MRLPPLWGFQGLSLLYLPSPEQGNVLCLHPLSSSKKSVTAEDSEEPVLAPRAKKEECFPASGGVFRVLCLFLGVFEGKIADVCFFPIFVHIFGVSHNWIIFPNFFSEPNICCRTTETSAVGKVTYIRLPENTYFFRATELEIVETQKSVFETMISSVSLVLFDGSFCRICHEIMFFLLYHLCNFIYFELIFFIEPLFC